MVTAKVSFSPLLNAFHGLVGHVSSVPCALSNSKWGSFRSWHRFLFIPKYLNFSWVLQFVQEYLESILRTSVKQSERDSFFT